MLALVEQQVAVWVFEVSQVRLRCVELWRCVVQQYIYASVEESLQCVFLGVRVLVDGFRPSVLALWRQFVEAVFHSHVEFVSHPAFVAVWAEARFGEGLQRSHVVGDYSCPVPSRDCRLH